MSDDIEEMEPMNSTWLVDGWISHDSLTWGSTVHTMDFIIPAGIDITMHPVVFAFIVFSLFVFYAQ